MTQVRQDSGETDFLRAVQPPQLIAVESQDGMTTDWVKLPYELLEKVSLRITNEMRSLNGVVLYFTSKPSGTIEWE